MSKFNLFKAILIVQTIVLLVYTFVTIKTEGANFISVYIYNVLALNWSGQFNLDFLCYLMLSGLWIMWRNRFTSTSMLLGAVAMVLGIVFFAPYLLWLTNKEKGDIKRIFLGDR